MATKMPAVDTAIDNTGRAVLREGAGCNAGREKERFERMGERVPVYHESVAGPDTAE